MRYKFLRFPNGKTKAVTFSYDDGCVDDVRMAKTLSEYNLKGTFNLNNDELRQGSGMSDDEVREYILKKGHEIAVHGAMHRAEGAQRPIDAIHDVLKNRLELEKKYGLIVRGMAYPDSGITRFSNGASYDNIKNYLKDLDIVYSRTLGGDNDEFMLPTDWYEWMPTAHHNNPEIFNYIDKFLSFDYEKLYGASRYPRLFYIWGHSYEFERNNNWDRLTEICEKISNNDDVWYATNIEIYNYVSAYNSLSYSADSSIIYNPSLYEIWFDIDGKLYSIKSGETLKI